MPGDKLLNYFNLNYQILQGILSSQSFHLSIFRSSMNKSNEDQENTENMETEAEKEKEDEKVLLGRRWIPKTEENIEGRRWIEGGYCRQVIEQI